MKKRNLLADRLKKQSQPARSGEQGGHNNAKTAKIRKKAVNRKAKRVKILAVAAAALLLIVGTFRLPSLIYSVIPKDDSFALSFTEKDVAGYLTADILKNWNDYGYANRIRDEKKTEKPLMVTYSGITAQISDLRVGFTKFNDKFYIKDFAGWILLKDTSGYPYISSKENIWTIPEYKQDGADVYISIPGTCTLQILSAASKPVTVVRLSGNTFQMKDSAARKPLTFLSGILFPQKSECPWNIGDIYQTTEFHLSKEPETVLAEAVMPKFNEKSTDRFTKPDFTLAALDKVYKLIDSGKTCMVSLYSQSGEALAIVYGYDCNGNLYVADYKSSQPKGKINVYPKANLCYNGETLSMSDWYEFEGLGFSSDAGYKMSFVFE